MKLKIKGKKISLWGFNVLNITMAVVANFLPNTFSSPKINVFLNIVQSKNSVWSSFYHSYEHIRLSERYCEYPPTHLKYLSQDHRIMIQKICLLPEDQRNDQKSSLNKKSSFELAKLDDTKSTITNMFIILETSCFHRDRPLSWKLSLFLPRWYQT